MEQRRQPAAQARSRAPVQLCKDEFWEHVATWEGVTLDEKNTFLRGEVVSMDLLGGRAHILHGLPLVCLRHTLSMPRIRAGLRNVSRRLQECTRIAQKVVVVAQHFERNGLVRTQTATPVASCHQEEAAISPQGRGEFFRKEGVRVKKQTLHFAMLKWP